MTVSVKTVLKDYPEILWIGPLGPHSRNFPKTFS